MRPSWEERTARSVRRTSVPMLSGRIENAARVERPGPGERLSRGDMPRDGTGITRVVAASNALDSSKARADYTCDGTADDLEFIAALTDMQTTGGTIELTEGTFWFANQVAFESDGPIILRGQGAVPFADPPQGTMILPEDADTFPDESLIDLGGWPVVVTDIQFGMYGGGGDGTRTWAFLTGSPFYFHIERCGFMASAANAIKLDGCVVLRISDNDFSYCQHTPPASADEDGVVLILGSGLVIEYSGNNSADNGNENGYDLHIRGSRNQGIRILGNWFGYGGGCRIENAGNVNDYGTLIADNHNLQLSMRSCNNITIHDNACAIQKADHVISLTDCTDSLIHDNLISPFGAYLPNNTFDGIYLESSSTESSRNNIRGNIFRNPDVGPSLRYALNINDATCADNIVVMNDFGVSEPYGTGAINDAGTGTLRNLDGSAADWNRQ